MIGYLNGQDGTFLPVQDYLLRVARNRVLFPYNNPLLTKLVGSRWLNIGLILSLSVDGHEHRPGS